MMKKILFVITLILLLVAYNNLHELISKSTFGMMNDDKILTREDLRFGWDAVLAAWPIALAGALVVGAPGLLVLAVLYTHAAAADNRELKSSVDEQLEKARNAVHNAKAEAERAIEHRIETARQIESHAEQLLSQSQQIKTQADVEIADMREKVADADAKRHRAFEGFNRIKRKNQQLEAAITAMNSASAGQALKYLGLLDNQTAEDETL